MNRAREEKGEAGAIVKHKAQGREVILPNYPAEEKVLLDRYMERRKSEPPHLEASLKNGICQIKYPEAPGEGLLWAAKMFKATGSADADLGNSFLAQALGTYLKTDGTTISRNLNNAITLLHGIGPQDEVEGMLAVQMVGAHNLAMEFLRRAMLPDQPADGVTENVNRATKLLRTFAAQMEALNKYRTKGQQKVIVEHVQVNAGGKAIVGIVENTPGRGGDGKN